MIGATAPQRSAWVERAMSAVEIDGTSAAPLTVSVRPRGASGTLVEELTARAEAVLDALRAPGALYDESSCAALPALGGWLFRARSVRRSGILFVIEELDDYLDLRGDRDRAEDALEVLGQLLEERERRPISLLCTVRAADAAGAPAIPAALAALFDERLSLGAAQAVVRDPAALLATLAGRSFTRSSLARAVSAWTEVADDESVIVFTTPLAPTMVPAASAPEEPELRWPSDELEPSAPEAKTSAIAREAERGLPRKPLAFEAERARWMATYRAALELRSALDTLGDPAARRSTRQLEKVFSRSIARIPLALEALEAGAPGVGARAAHLERRARAALSTFERSFSEAYASAFSAWAAGATRPLMLPDLVERLHALAAERSARTAALLLCTGLRADEWPLLSTAIGAKASGLSVLEEGLHWAARPLTVAGQRALLSRGASALGAPISERDEPPVPRSLEEASLARREVVQHGEFHRITAYRFALSAPAKDGAGASGSLTARLERARGRVSAAIASFVTALPVGSVVLIASDVGATESDRSEPDDSRRSDASVFEVLVPHAFVLWGEGRL